MDQPLLPTGVEIQLLGQRAVCVSREFHLGSWRYGFEIPTHKHMGIFWYRAKDACRYLTEESMKFLGI